MLTEVLVITGAGGIGSSHRPAPGRGQANYGVIAALRAGGWSLAA